MTEADWLACADPQLMLEYVDNPSDNANPCHLYRPSDRKLRLFACACHQAADLTDTQAYRFMRESDGQRWTQNNGDDAYVIASAWCGEISRHSLSQQTRADLLRHIVGNPWRPLLSRTCGSCKGSKTERYCDAAGDIDDRDCRVCKGRGRLAVPRPVFPAVVVQLAEAIYQGDNHVGFVEVPDMLHVAENEDQYLRGIRLGMPKVRDSASQLTLAMALHDALLDAGDPLGMAEHFEGERVCRNCRGKGAYRKQSRMVACDNCCGTGKAGFASHPLGCAWLDTILGKE